jgi:hypothetical protein
MRRSCQSLFAPRKKKTKNASQENVFNSQEEISDKTAQKRENNLGKKSNYKYILRSTGPSG